MSIQPRYQPEGSAGGPSSRESRELPRESAEDVTDPFFKDPAVTIGEDVAKSLASADPDASHHDVIRDGYTDEVPYEAAPNTYDGSSFGAQMTKMVKDSQRESDTRPKGIDAKDLEAIYGKRWRSDDTLIVNPGPPKKEFSIWHVPGIRLLIKLLILAAIIGAISAIHIGIVDEDGVDTSKPLPVWIYLNMTMTNEQRMMQNLAPSERPFAMTLNRIRRVAAAASEYELTLGVPPRHVEDLVNENLILPFRTSDGWGNFFRIESDGEVVVRSAGKDGAFQTGDDIRVVGGASPHFELTHYSRESQGIDVR